MARYCRLYDNGDFEAYAQLFSDARVVGPLNTLNSVEEIVAYHRSNCLLYDGSPQTRHVTTNIEIVEWARYLELVRLSPSETPMEMWLDGYNGSTAQILFNQRWNCNGFTPVGINVHGFCDNAIDQLVLQSQRTLDEGKRNELLSQAQQLISKDAPSIWGVASVETTGASKKLHNALIYKSELVTVDEHTWLEA